MNTLFKTAVVLAGFAASLLAAIAAVYLQNLLRPAELTEASSGMYAFGDALLFLGVFVTLSLIPSALGLYFLRPSMGFWKALAAAVLAVAAIFALIIAALATL